MIETTGYLQQPAEIGTGRDDLLIVVSGEEARTGDALQAKLKSALSQAAALTHAQHRDIVLFQGLLDASCARLAHVSRVRIWIQIVRIDLKGDQAKCFERTWLDDRHVIGRAQAGVGHVRARAYSNITQVASSNTPQHRLEQVVLLQGLEQAETLPSAHKPSYSPSPRLLPSPPPPQAARSRDTNGRFGS